MPREVARRGDAGKIVKASWMRINKGSGENPQVRRRLVAQELGFV